MSDLRLLPSLKVNSKLISSTDGTYENPVLVDITPPTSPTPNEVDDPHPSPTSKRVDVPSLPSRLGPPLPIELVSMIIRDLKHGRQYATLAKLAQANSAYFNLAMPKLYETITISATNAMELDLGYGPSDPESEMPMAHVFGLDDYWEARDAPASDMRPTARCGSRKDLAQEKCLRLIIDVAIDIIPDYLDLVFARLGNRFTNVREVVLTRRSLRDIQKVDPDDAPEVVTLPGPSTTVNRDNSAMPINKPKRVVLYLSPAQSRAMSHLSHWSRCRPALRSAIQFVIYGINLYFPAFDLCCMDVECHFGEAGIPPGAFEHALAAWLYDLFARNKPETHPRLRLYDIPSLVFKDENRPINTSEANQAARDLIESLLDSKKRFGGKAKYLKGVMSKIDFCDSVYVDEEYPVVEPRPVSTS